MAAQKAKQAEKRPDIADAQRPSREQIKGLVDLSMQRAAELIDAAIEADRKIPWADASGLAQAIRDASRAALGLRPIDPILVEHLRSFHALIAGAALSDAGEISLPEPVASPPTVQEELLPPEEAREPEVLPPGDPTGGVEARPVPAVGTEPAPVEVLPVAAPAAGAVAVAPPRATVAIERGLAPTNMDELYRMSKAVFASGLAPKSLRTTEAVFTAIATGLELGLRPMAALRAIYVVNGMPALKGEAGVALVRQSGRCRYWRPSVEGEGDERVGVIRSMRTDGTDALETRFSVKQAKAAGLWNKSGSPWQTFPDRMLVWRAVGHHISDHYSDVSLGVPLAEIAQDLPASIEPALRAEAPDEPDPLLS